MRTYLIGLIFMIIMWTNTAYGQEIATSFGSPFENDWTTYLDGETYTFGQYVADWNGWHAGVDSSIDRTPTGTNVFAIGNGIVRFANSANGYGNNGGSGYAVVIEHTLEDGGHILSLYGHLQNGAYNANAHTGLVPTGTVVTKGQYIGKIADYLWGANNWHHLHFGVRPGSYQEIGQTAALRGYEETQEAIGEYWWHPTELLTEDTPVIFADTPPQSWYLEDLAELYMLAVVNGYEATPGLFGPENTVTRAEFCKMVVEGMNVREPETYRLDGVYATWFSDVTAAEWFYDYVLVLADANVVDGYGDGRFGPNDPITRAQSAKILAQGFWLDDETWVDEPWEDFSTGDDMYEEALSLYAYGVMNGYPDGAFRPDNNLTRAEAAAIIQRAITAETVRVDPN